MQDADATELGEEVQLSVDVTNMGPSAASSVTLDIYIPTNDAPGSYYLYLYDLETMETPGTCDRTSINPDNLQVPDNTRRKRCVHCVYNVCVVHVCMYVHTYVRTCVYMYL